MSKKLVRKYFVLLLCFMLSGCGFHPRSAKEFPSELKYVYFSSVKPYARFSNALRDLLHSVNVVMVDKKSAARFSIAVIRDHFSYKRPAIVDATFPTILTFSQNAKITVVDNCTQQTIVSKTFYSKDSLTLNTNQAYTTNANGLIHRELNRHLISLVYYWLISEKTKEALALTTKKGSACKLP